MTRTLRVGALIAVALAVVLTLSACVSPLPTPTPTPTPVATPTPTPSTAADPITTVAALVMRPESLQLMDVDGTVVAHLDYLSDPADAVGVLTALFGAAPTDEDFSGSSHFPPTTAHRWGDFTLWEQRYVDTW